MPETMPPALTMSPASTTRAREMRAAGAIPASRSIGTLPNFEASSQNGLLAVGGGLAVEQAHGAIDPGAGADAGEQRFFGEHADEVVQAVIVRLLAGAEARDQEGIHIRPVEKAIIVQHGEPRSRLHRAHGVGDEKGVELGEDAVRRGIVDDLCVLEDVDARGGSLASLV
jgi:hypothetical protein